MKFTELGLDDQLIEALGYAGFEDATPIQEEAIPAVLKGQDLLACAQTGTGKTGAFLIPILNKLIGKEDRHTNTLIIAPTRELAIQIEQQIQGLSYFISVGSIAIYGGGDGKDFDAQKDALVNGSDVIVATPGKLISHLHLGYVNFQHIQHLVLDEADRMLDMGFINDLKTIIRHLPKEHQTLMFSATFPPKIQQLAKSILKDPKEISLNISKPAEGVTQHAYVCFDEQKNALLNHILKDKEHYDSVIIFTSSKMNVNTIVRALNKQGFKAQGISSNLDQEEREEVLRGFRSKRIRILVATDVMSRGIDIKEINMVINYDVPHEAADYVHRVGRTARANTKGEAYTLINPKDMIRMHRIHKLIDNKVPQLEVPEELGATPEWRDPKPRPQNSGTRKKKKFFKPKKKPSKD